MPLDQNTKSVNVLIVENEVTDFELLKRQYVNQRPETNVVQASSVADAKQDLDSGGIDGVIRDLNLGDGSGIELVRHVS